MFMASEQHQALEGLHQMITLFVCGRQNNPTQVRLLKCVSVFPMLVVGLLPISKADQFSIIHTGGRQLWLNSEGALLTNKLTETTV